MVRESTQIRLPRASHAVPLGVLFKLATKPGDHSEFYSFCVMRNIDQHFSEVTSMKQMIFGGDVVDIRPLSELPTYMTEYEREITTD